MTRDADWRWNALLDYVDFWVHKHGASVINRAAEILLGCRYIDEDDEFEWITYSHDQKMIAEIVCHRHPLEALRRILRIMELLLGDSENVEPLGHSEQDLAWNRLGITATIDEIVPIIRCMTSWLSFDQHMQLLRDYSSTLERFEGNFARRLIGVILCDTLGLRLEKDAEIETQRKNELCEALKTLCKSALIDPCNQIREMAVRAGLYSDGLYSNEELKAVLEQATRDESVWVRSAAYWRMANLGEWGAARLIEAAWDEENIDVIAEVLVDIWKLQTLSKLYELHESGDADLKDRVQRIIRKLQRVRSFGVSEVDSHQVAKQVKLAMRLMGFPETE